MIIDPVLSPHDVATELGCSYLTVCEHLRAGELRGVKRGNRWYIRRSAVDEFLHPGPARHDVA